MSTPTTKSFAPEVIADNSGEFCGNGLRFPTSDEAEQWVVDLRTRWILVRDTRVVESDEPANYNYVDGEVVPITEAPA